MPADTHRVSYYYAAYDGRGTSQLHLLMGTTPNVSQMTEVLFADSAVDNRGWLNAYALLKDMKAGTYYFALVAGGSMDAPIVGRFKVDDEEDLCIGNTRFVQRSGYNLSTSKVTIGVVNHGVTPQSGFSVKYFVNPVPDSLGQVATPRA